MADVLIRGMDMGNVKTGCPFRVDDFYGGSDCVAGSDYCTAPFANRGADCPVVVLPEGHGRLIGADALDKFLAEREKEAEAEEFYLGESWYNTFRQILRKRPTIVPAEGGGEE